MELPKLMVDSSEYYGKAEIVMDYIILYYCPLNTTILSQPSKKEELGENCCV